MKADFTNPDRLIVEVVGEPYLSRVAAYRAELNRTHDAWLQWAITQGGTPSSGYHMGLFFIGSEPRNAAQWRKKDSRGWTVPKKGTPAATEMATLPKKPSTFAIFEEVPGTITWRGPEPDTWGNSIIGSLFGGPSLGWCADRIFAVLPDCRTARVEALKDHPGCTIDEPAASWTVPAGLNEVTEAYYKFVFAEAALKAEEGKKRADKGNHLSAV